MKGIVLIDYFIKKYPPAPSPQGKAAVEGEPDPLALDLRNYVRERGVKPDQIVVGLPKEQVILKEILLPKVEEKQLQEMLEYEVERHIPFAVQNVAFDYQILSREENSLRVLLGVVKKDDLQKILTMLDLEQAKPVVVDITSVAGVNWLIAQNDLGEDATTALVDIGENRVDLGLLAGKEIRITRSFRRIESRLEDAYLEESFTSETGEESGQAWTRDEASVYQSSTVTQPSTMPQPSTVPQPSTTPQSSTMTPSSITAPFPIVEEGQNQDEENFKGNDLSGDVPGAHQPESSTLFQPVDESVSALGQDIIRELEIAMHVFSDFQDQRVLDNIILTGTDAYSGLLPEYIHARAGVQPRILNPLKNITTRSIPGKITSSLSAATGLALRGLEDQPLMLNFLASGKKIKRKRNHFVATVVFMVLIVVMSLAWVIGLSYQSSLISSEMTRRLKSLQPDVTEVKNISLDIEKIDKELSNIDKVVGTEVSKMEILKELTTTLPADTWLDNMDVSNEKLEIGGYSESPSNLIPMLEISPLLENVQFASSITKMGPGKERFKIKANVERGKDAADSLVPSGKEKAGSKEKAPEKEKETGENAEQGEEKP
ncbi:MAG: pilus assembly protein PilM [bacterium]